MKPTPPRTTRPPQRTLEDLYEDIFQRPPRPGTRRPPVRAERIA